MDDLSLSTQSLVTEKERDDLAKLCWLLHEAGTVALRVTFDSIHPPLCLKEHLARYTVKAILVKLMDARVLEQKHWSVLYPTKNKPVTSQNYDAKLMLILLETVCHLSAPYPGGWQTTPIQTDTSMSADLVRLQKILQQIASLSGVRQDEYPILWEHCVEVLERLGGQLTKDVIMTIEIQSVPEDKADSHIHRMKDIWSHVKEKNIKRLRRLYNKGAKAMLSPIAQHMRAKHEKEGLSPEDKEVLSRMNKPLVEQVIAEDILDRLQQGQIIKIGDRHDIMANPKNIDRMHVVLEKLVASKSTYGLKLLCDALKFNFPTIYEAVMECRKEVYKQGVKETVDLVKVSQEGLANRYKTVFSSYCPIPWNDNFNVNVYDYYVGLDVIDQEGQKLDLRDILPKQKAAGIGKRIVIEGCSGSGNSTLAAVLSYMWAKDKTYFKHVYDFLVYIDVQYVVSDFSRLVFHMVIPENTPINGQEFWSVLEANARKVVVLVDGYDDRIVCSKLDQILRGTRLRKSSVILFVQPEMHFEKDMRPDYRLFNTGLGESGRLEFMKSYAHLLKLTPENVEVLKEYLTKKEWPLLPHLSSPFVCFMVIMVFQGNTEFNMLTITSLSSLCECYCILVARQCCKRLNVSYFENEFPDKVNDAIKTLGSLAFNAVVSGKVCFFEEDVSQYSSKVCFTRCGAMSRNNLTSGFRFVCSIFMDFLAAQHMAVMSYDEVGTTIRENNFLANSRYAQLISFVCGLYEEHPDTPTLDNLLQKLTEEGSYEEIAIEEMENTADEEANANEFETNGTETNEAESPEAHLHEADIDKPVAPEIGISEAEINATELNGTEIDEAKDIDDMSETFQEGPLAHILNYSHRLHGVFECHERHNSAGNVAKSMSTHILIRRKGLFHTNCILGISFVLESQHCRLTHLDINLLPVYIYQDSIYTRLAEAIAKNNTLQHLKIYWWSLDKMAKFLHTVMCECKVLERLHLHDCTNRTLKKISSVTWSTLQDMCNNCKYVKRFVFENCQTSAVVGHVIEHLPPTVEECDFSKCLFNLMCSNILAAKLESSDTFRHLVLCEAKLHSSDVEVLTHGIKRSSALQELDLSNTKLDKVAITAIAETIKLSITLKILDLSNCDLDAFMCNKLANALQYNRTMKKLILEGSKLSSRGLESLLDVTKTKMGTFELVR